MKPTPKRTAEAVLKARGPGLFRLRLILDEEEMRHLRTVNLDDAELGRLIAIVLRSTETVNIEKMVSHCAHEVFVTARIHDA